MKNLAKILVVDDDTRLRNLLVKYLSDNNFSVGAASSADEAREIIARDDFDLLVVDIMMPKENGIEFTKWLKTNNKIPVLILTARGSSSDRIDGLEAGADDYMPKPFEPRELLLRINNILKHAPESQNSKKNKESLIVRFGEFTFDLANSRLHRAGDFIHLTGSEARIMVILSKNINEIVSREQLAKLCGDVDVRSIDVQMTRLRKKIEDNPKEPVFLQTARHEGYVLKN